MASPVHPVPERLRDPAECPQPHVDSMEAYEALYDMSIRQPRSFWDKMAKALLTWTVPYSTVFSGSLEHGDVAWFGDGYLNACVNCVDRHASLHPDRVAIIYEADEPGHAKRVTYAELMRDVCRLANALRDMGVRKGHPVAIYMPMVPQVAVAMLACARIGAVHTVVFAGFSADSLAERVSDAGCRVLITANEGMRGGKVIPIKKIVDTALLRCPSVQHCIVFRRTDTVTPTVPNRDIDWDECLKRHRPFCPPALVSAEDPLFLLYTSGSTGKPKGMLHTTGGYLLGAAMTVKYVFDTHEGDIFGCVADVGWVTGHSYLVYGPLSLGLTTVFFESVPTYPDARRYWQLVDEHKITHFYTAPTAIRALRRLGDSWVADASLSSLRVIGSVGEPINPEAWKWYDKVVGRGRCAVIDTYWQTETGSIIVTPLPAAIPTKPGSATLPFFGIDVAVLDPATGKELTGSNVSGVLAIRRPWPSMARTIAGDHDRYMTTYFKAYPGFYFTGDGVHRDEDGYYWVRGRVDDVINVSGHRMSTAELESALIQHETVAEAAVVGAPDDIAGQCICAFVTLKPEYSIATAHPEACDTIKAEHRAQVRRLIGAFATPKHVVVVEELPKTRSGKIIRRILRKIVAGELDSLGDLSTLADPGMIDVLIERVHAQLPPIPSGSA